MRWRAALRTRARAGTRDRYMRCDTHRCGYRGSDFAGICPSPISISLCPMCESERVERESVLLTCTCDSLQRSRHGSLEDNSGSDCSRCTPRSTLVSSL
eukprot:scaffold276216_cov40-Tisochrysis_lutea.AAC.1